MTDRTGCSDPNCRACQRALAASPHRALHRVTRAEWTGAVIRHVGPDLTLRESPQRIADVTWLVAEELLSTPVHATDCDLDGDCSCDAGAVVHR